MKTLTLTDVLQRSLHISKDDVSPLVKYLDMPDGVLNKPSREAAQTIADYLCKMGSNDIATLFRGKGVAYDEVVVDVGEKLKAKDVSARKSVEDNEASILAKLFADALDHMSEEEK